MTAQPNRNEVQLYLNEARGMLVVAKANLEQGFYSSAVNRTYYAVFYAANALLSTKGKLGECPKIY